MFEALNLLYNRFFGSSTRTGVLDEPQKESTASPLKGFFSGSIISFFFGPPKNKPSFLQKIFPWFFSTAAAPHDSDQIGKEIGASMNYHSSTGRSSGSSLKIDELNKERLLSIENSTKEPLESSFTFPTWTSVPSTSEEAFITSLKNETISLYVDGFAEGEKVHIRKQGQKKFDSLEDLESINEELISIKDAYQKNPNSYLESFNKDANRGFTYTVENPFITNKETKRPDHSDYTSAIAEDPRVIQAHMVIDTLAKTIFPYDQMAEMTLGNSLKGISQQVLFALPLLAFMKHPPSDGSCLIQGSASNANFSYSISSPQKIVIQATGFYQNASDNTLFGTIENDQHQLEAIPLAFPKDGQNQSTGKITGSVALAIIARVSESGTLTSLSCTSVETSWNAREREHPEK